MEKKKRSPRKQIIFDEVAQTKNCTKCNRILSLDSFNVRTNWTAGRNSRCKECIAKQPKRSVEGREAVKAKLAVNSEEAIKRRERFIANNGTTKPCKMCKKVKRISTDNETSDFYWNFGPKHGTAAFNANCKNCHPIFVVKYRIGPIEYIAKLKSQGCTNQSPDYKCSDDIDFAHYPGCTTKKRDSSGPVQFSHLRDIQEIDEELKLGRFLCGICHAHETEAEIKEKNKNQIKDENRSQRLIYQDKTKAMTKRHVNKLKEETGCVMCKLQVTTTGKREDGKAPLRYFQYDHLDPDCKTMSVAQMISSGYQLGTILAEIDKCELVCSGCHLKRTNARVKEKGPTLQEQWKILNMETKTETKTSDSKVDPPILPKQSKFAPLDWYAEHLNKTRARLDEKSPTTAIESKFKPESNRQKWKRLAPRMNPVADIHKHLPAPQCVPEKLKTIAYSKMLEMICKHGSKWFSRPNSQASQLYTSLHLCEAPGAFVCATHAYFDLLSTHCKTEIRHGWIASSLVDDLEASNRKMDATTEFIRQTKPHWKIGPAGGDLLNWKTIEFLTGAVYRGLGGPVHFVSGGGAIGTDDDPNNQERDCFPLLAAQVITAVRCLAQGGGMIIKMFSAFRKETQLLLFAVSLLFEHVEAIKPDSSKPGNSEKYILATGFRPKSFEQLPVWAWEPKVWERFRQLWSEAKKPEHGADFIAAGFWLFAGCLQDRFDQRKYADFVEHWNETYEIPFAMQQEAYMAKVLDADESQTKYSVLDSIAESNRLAQTKWQEWSSVAKQGWTY